MSAYNITLDYIHWIVSEIYLAIFVNVSSIPELHLLGIVLMLSLALVTLSNFSELKLEVLGALAGVLKPITFSVRCIFGGQINQQC